MGTSFYYFISQKIVPVRALTSYVLCECSVTFELKCSGVSSISDVPR